MDELLRDFIAETNEHLAILDRDLVAIEQNPNNSQLLDDAFRSVHSIKGTCSFLGLKRLETLLHAVENLLGKIRDRALPGAPAAIGTLLSACDRARLLVGALAKEGHELDGADGDIIARLELSARSTVTSPIMEAPVVPEAVAVPIAADASIRVNIDTIDRLMAEVSELVLARNQVMQLLRGRTDGEAALALQRLSQVTSDLQESVMKTRMQPIGQAWAKLPRVVRDLGRELGKKIELKLEGSGTELDRQVLELVKDPFTHLVRNAADHGIESAAERRRAGKPEAGTITLSARQEGSAIVITLSDDGRGIDLGKLRAAARRGGFVAETELRAMTEQQLQQLLFNPGFTTAAQVTSVSGRGVGLDVVRSNVEKIGGTVELASTVGRGTRFTVKIPLTLAIVPALLLDCAGQRFAIPQTAVAELVCAGDEHRIEWIHDAPVLRLRGSLLPLVGLDEVLGLGKHARGTGETLVAVVGYGTQRFGVMIDGVDDAEEIVVKSLSPMLRGVKLFAGCTILGDGSVVLILDPGALAAAVGAVETVEPSRVAPPQPKLGAFSRGGGMLVFRADGDSTKAIPLGVIIRIEDIAAREIAQIDGQPAMSYRGSFLPLHVFGALSRRAIEFRVVIASQDGRSIGFLVDEIVDTVDENLVLDRAVARPGLLGVATLAGRLTEIVDIAYYTAVKGVEASAPARSAA
jgi:two-component system, chemotaxis family, sensor kinase CheA